MKRIQKLLEIIAQRYWTSTHCYEPIYQGMVENEVEDRELIYDGGSTPNLSCWDVYVIYYRDMFFICSENSIMFFEKERLTDYLTGRLDEFWGLFPQNYGPIIYEQEILEMQKYFVDKKALMNLASNFKDINRQ